MQRFSTASVLTATPDHAMAVAALVGLRELWGETRGDSRVFVAIIDGPVDTSHPAFLGKRLEVLEDGLSPSDAAAEHATHIASIVFGQDGGPVHGIAPGCSGLVIPVFKSDATGGVIPCSQVHLAAAIERATHYAVQHDAEALVINISGGQFSQSGEAHPVLARTIADCDQDKVLIVAAAGNQGCNCLHVPGAIPSVLAVGAMRPNGEPLDFSNWGDAYLTQGVLAVGENILGASPTRGTAIASGTSYAAPIVAGIAALLLSLQLRRGIKPSAAAVRSAIIGSATGCDIQAANDCRKLLAGRLSISRTVETLLREELPPMTTDTTATASETASSPPEVHLLTPTAGVSAMPDQLVTPVPAVGAPPAFITIGAGQSGVQPSGGCSCGGAAAAKPVFAVGTLAYDFPSIARREDIRRRMKGEERPVIQDDLCFMRHLFRVNPDGTGPGELNLQEASRVHWVLEYAGVPQYVIQPTGLSAATDLTSLVFDYMEQQGLADAHRKLRLGKADTPLNKKDRPDHFAVPGYVTGQMAVLAETGQTVPILTPEYDLTDSWNLDSVLKDLEEKALLNMADEERVAAYRRTAAALYAFVHPKGDTPEARAVNFLASVAVQFALDDLVDGRRIALKGLYAPVRVESRQPGALVYEITAAYFDTENVRNANYCKTFRIDVSTPKPYLDGSSEISYGTPKFL
ncbi:MAG: S8 family serine peptidase [Lamprocystis purpurea]|nr:S8 family serine peptidase [Lamprocystis purpurea]